MADFHNMQFRYPADIIYILWKHGILRQPLFHLYEIKSQVCMPICSFAQGTRGQDPPRRNRDSSPRSSLRCKPGAPPASAGWAQTTRLIPSSLFTPLDTRIWCKSITPLWNAAPQEARYRSHMRTNSSPWSARILSRFFRKFSLQQCRVLT